MSTETQEPWLLADHCKWARDFASHGILLSTSSDDNPGLDQLRILLQTRSNALFVSHDGWPLLSRAAQQHNADFVKLMVQHGVDVDCLTRTNSVTPLIGGATPTLM